MIRTLAAAVVFISVAAPAAAQFDPAKYTCGDAAAAKAGKDAGAKMQIVLAGLYMMGYVDARLGSKADEASETSKSVMREIVNNCISNPERHDMNWRAISAAAADVVEKIAD